MTKTTLRDWQMLKSDISFGLMGAIGIIGILVDSFDMDRNTVLPANPWLTASMAVLLTVVVGFLVTKVATIDRKRSEEYTFQVISSGAVVAVVTTLFVTFAWSSDLLLSRWLGQPTIGQIIALLMGSWSIGYLTYRIKGVGE